MFYCSSRSSSSASYVSYYVYESTTAVRSIVVATQVNHWVTQQINHCVTQQIDHWVAQQISHRAAPADQPLGSPLRFVDSCLSRGDSNPFFALHFYRQHQRHQRRHQKRHQKRQEELRPNSTNKNNKPGPSFVRMQNTQTHAREGEKTTTTYKWERKLLRNVVRATSPVGVLVRSGRSTRTVVLLRGTIVNSTKYC